MGLIGSFLSTAVGADKQEDRGAILARYKRLRNVGRALNGKMVGSLAPDVLEEGAKRLGLYRRGTFVFNCEEETSVLMDYCLYHVRRRGLNSVERYLRNSPPPEGSDEMACLRAAQRQWYSVFVVRERIRGFGARVEDLLSGETLDIVDLGFSTSAQPGYVFVSRMLPCEGFIMTGGASMPLGKLPEDKVSESKREAAIDALSALMGVDPDGHPDPGPLLRVSLAEGNADHLRSVDVLDDAPRKARGPRQTGEARFCRNMKCPCGSGRRYKNCCMRK